MRCENCGSEAVDLVFVHRIYLLMDPDTELAHGVELDAVRLVSLEIPEQWCWSCRSQYPSTPCVIGAFPDKDHRATCLPPDSSAR